MHCHEPLLPLACQVTHVYSRVRIDYITIRHFSATTIQVANKTRKKHKSSIRQQISHFFLTLLFSMKTLAVKLKMSNCAKQALQKVRKMVTWSTLPTNP